MWLVSNRWIWIPGYVILAILLFRKRGVRSGTTAIIIIAFLIILTDQTCASVLKPTLCRLRPSSPDNPISALVTLVNNYHGGQYGFPSCHAANTFALAIFLSLQFNCRYATVALICWSLLVSYSRIYLGVHYPADILGGFVVGGTYAVILYKAHSLIDTTIPAYIKSV